MVVDTINNVQSKTYHKEFNERASFTLEFKPCNLIKKYFGIIYVKVCVTFCFDVFYCKYNMYVDKISFLCLVPFKS